MRRYVYQRSGGPILNWNKQIPLQTRAADSVALGSLGDPTIELPLPRPGSPEPVGCDCQSGVTVIDLMSPSFLLGLAVGYFILKK